MPSDTKNPPSKNKAFEDSKLVLAAFLAIHHHKNNLAMMFTNPSPHVRTLLSYVLYKLKNEVTVITQSMKYRSVISLCHQQFLQVQMDHEQGKLSNEDTVRLALALSDKASLAEVRLKELVNASN